MADLTKFSPCLMNIGPKSKKTGQQKGSDLDALNAPARNPLPEQMVEKSPDLPQAATKNRRGNSFSTVFGAGFSSAEKLRETAVHSLKDE